MRARHGVRPARAGAMSGGAGSGPTAANAPGTGRAGVRPARAPAGRHVRRDHAPAMPRGAGSEPTAVTAPGTGRAGVRPARAPARRHVRRDQATAMPRGVGSGPTAANAPAGDCAGVMRAGANVRRAGSRNRPESPRLPARIGHGPDPAAASALPSGGGRTRRGGAAMRNAPGAHGDRRGEPNRRKPGGPIDGSMVARPPGPGTGPGVDGPTVHQLPHHCASPDQVVTAAAADRSGTGDTGARTGGLPTGMRVNRAAGEHGTYRAITIAVRVRPHPPARPLPSTADRSSARRGMPVGTGDREVAAEPGMRRAPMATRAISAPAGQPVDVGIRALGRPVIRSSCCGLARRRRRS